VLIANDTSFETRYEHMRAGARLNSRVAIAVEWTDGGKNLRAEGYTVDVSPKGCLAIVPQGFTVGQKLQLINLTNQKTSEAFLIWRGHEGRTGWELGLEIQDKTEDFWGIEF
jgi:PilZ domain-containing protein